MPLCPAITKKRTPCTREGTKFEGHCGIHHASKYTSDPAYRARYNATVTTNRVEEAAPTERQREIEAKRAANARVMAGLVNPTAFNILEHATKVIKMWRRERIPGMDCAKAYAILKYMPLNEFSSLPHIFALTRACAQLHLLLHHPEFEQYADVPVVEKEAAYAALRTALVPYAVRNTLDYLPTSDLYRAEIDARMAEERQRQRQQEQQERRRQMEIAMRERPVVFRRDPEGSIDLRAFAVDHQNVHRSSVQNATQKACLTLMKRPLGTGQTTLPEVVLDLQDPTKVRFTTPALLDRVVAELTHDYFETEAFSLSYGDVLDRVWAYIRCHVDRKDLFIRLAQEITEGLAQCNNGKMARLVNTLQGYDETIQMDPPKEMFQNSISMLTHAPLAEREPRARALFLEYAIPEAEQAAWLEPLLDS